MSNSIEVLNNELLQKRLPIAERDFEVAGRGPAKLSAKTWRRASLFGWAVLIGFCVVFGGWAYVAPLASGVRAQGQIRVESEQQIVQHLEGGIVKEILVAEGDTVSKGQVLIRLDPLSTDAEYARLNLEILALLAETARLESEREGHENVIFPEELLRSRDDPEVARLIAQERNLFRKEQKAIADREQLLRERISQLQIGIEGSQERLSSTENQIAIIEEEFRGVQQLFDKGLERKPRVLALERAKEQLRGVAAQLKSQIAQNRQAIGEQELRLVAMKNERESQVAGALRNNALRLNGLREVENISRDRINRIDIRAPRDGQIVALNVHTVGGVVSSGQPIMSIVPTNDELIVTAKVKPKDVDAILVGAPVQVQLSAFNPRLTPPVDGTLTSISLDAKPDPERRGSQFFEARIHIDPESLKIRIPNAKLTAGMRASALISVGERTLFEYIMTPLSASLNQAMREP